jgi:hypothetical protein
MSPANRRNPDHTNADGHFGWDVWAGFYLVQASHRGCSAAHGRVATTKLLQVPPPVSDLRLVLRCPHLRRTGTRTSLRLKSIPVGQTMLIARVKTARGHALRGGVVIFSVGRHRLGEAPLTRRNGVVAITVRHLARNARVLVVYEGNGVYAPSRGSARAR